MTGEIERVYETGQTVVLRSGGVLMTVEEVLDDGSIRCVWHARDGYLSDGEFTAAMIERCSRSAYQMSAFSTWVTRGEGGGNG